jgi:hypothetical protein
VSFINLLLLEQEVDSLSLSLSLSLSAARVPVLETAGELDLIR